MTNDPILNKFHYFYSTASMEYHSITKLEKFVPQRKNKKFPQEWTNVYYKGYPRFNKILLPKPLKLGSFDKAIYQRGSCRSFSSKALTIKELSTILYFMAGLNPSRTNISLHRFYPSAGARYPLEVYPIIFNVKGVSMGVYHYQVRTHMLEFMWSYNDLNKRVMKNIGMQEFKKSSVLFVISGIFGRTERKYGPRGYRHVLLEVGHMSQNLYLTTSALGLACCSIGGFLDDGINRLLDIDGIAESSLIVIASGNRKGGG